MRTQTKAAPRLSTELREWVEDLTQRGKVIAAALGINVMPLAQDDLRFWADMFTHEYPNSMSACRLWRKQSKEWLAANYNWPRCQWLLEFWAYWECAYMEIDTGIVPGLDIHAAIAGERPFTLGGCNWIDTLKLHCKFMESKN